MTHDTKILVTGGAGYIGSHVCKALKQQGYIPVVYDNLCSGNQSAVKWGPFEEGDIRDRNRLSEVITKHQPKAIMHFAALIQVAESMVEPSLYYHNNLYGALCLLEEAKQHNIQHMVISSTAAVYGLPKLSSIPEDTAKLPINTYGKTKLMMEQMIEDFSSAYELRYATLRYFNVAGADAECDAGTAYKKDTHIIPLLMNVASGQLPSIKIFGTDYETEDGTAVRDYVHVSDIADAHIKALNHILAGKENITLNIGTNKGLSVQTILEMARDITGHPIPAEIAPRRSGDPDILVADATKAQKILNWTPVHSSPETIIKTAWAWKQKSISTVG